MTVMSFKYEESRNQLENKSFVYTLRPQYRHTGKNWYNHFRGDTKKGDIHVKFIGDFSNREEDLEPFVKGSGFDSLEKWLKKAKKSRYLYKVRLL